MKNLSLFAGALALACLPSVANAQERLPSIDAPIEYGAIFQIHCVSPQMSMRGTAFHIGQGRVISAAHVSMKGRCEADGVPLETVREDEKLDVVEFHSPVMASRPALKVSCRVPRQGEWLRAVGWGVLNFRLTLPLIFSGNIDPDFGFLITLGTVEKGMSGGPDVDSKGRVVAINNMHSSSRLRSLTETWVCP
jgi:hypothetical protein